MIGAAVIAVNANDVARPVIRDCSFLAGDLTAKGVALGSATSGALITGNDLSPIGSGLQISDGTTSGDTIARDNLGYPPRHTRTVTSSTTVLPRFQ